MYKVSVEGPLIHPEQILLSPRHSLNPDVRIEGLRVRVREGRM